MSERRRVPERGQSVTESESYVLSGDSVPMTANISAARAEDR